MIPLNALTTAVWTEILPLAQKVPADKDVKAGWLGFGVFLALAVAVVLLWFSFRKQLTKVNFDDKPADDRGARQTGGPAVSRNGAGPDESGSGSAPAP